MSIWGNYKQACEFSWIKELFSRVWAAPHQCILSGIHPLILPIIIYSLYSCSGNAHTKGSKQFVQTLGPPLGHANLLSTLLKLLLCVIAS